MRTAVAFGLFAAMAASAGVVVVPPATAATESPESPVSTAASPVVPAPTGDGDLLVRFAPGTNSRAAERTTGRAGAEIQGTAGETGFSVVSTGGRPVDEVRRELEASPLVQQVEPNRVRHLDALPNDPRYSVAQAGYLQAINLPAAWDRTTGGDGEVLAILDSGVDFGHPDLAGRLLPGWDFVHNNGVPADDEGHGTEVAGVAAARTNNGRGVAGVAWRGWIMPVKVLDATGSATDANIAAGITWAVDHGADVINLSLGGPGASSTLQTAVDYATSRNVLVVAAAGNDGNSEPHYPAACTGVISVGATDSANRRASWSNYGDWVDLVAPGVNITTTANGTTEKYAVVSGTSFSSPLVAGVAMLLRAADPSASQATIADRLRQSALDLGPPGYDVNYGYGLVNASGALALTPVLGAGASSAASVGSGYWMLRSDGLVYPFGDARDLGSPAGSLSAPAADLEPTPSGKGYWIADTAGHVYAYGGAPTLVGRSAGAPAGWLQAGESITSLSSTPSGWGFWMFTTAGRVLSFGDAGFFGDLAGVRLNAPVLDSIPTPTGQGYYMVAGDGGIFAFGDAKFYGSMGDKKLNAPVQSLVPNPDGAGYWLVASDGGVFAFDAPFRGSMGGTKLNAPVTGMVAYGNGYLMVATDGGLFDFSDLAFSGSLGGVPLPSPITAVAAL
jgi:subtilisin family serine protease